jgi:hypothetical protein
VGFCALAIDARPYEMASTPWPQLQSFADFYRRFSVPAYLLAFVLFAIPCALVASVAFARIERSEPTSDMAKANREPECPEQADSGLLGPDDPRLRGARANYRRLCVPRRSMGNRGPSHGGCAPHPRLGFS